MALPLKYNVGNLLARRTSSLMAALGAGLTALMLVVLLAMGEGMQSSVKSQASPERVILLHKGAPAEWSDITRDIPPIVSALPEVRRASQEYVNTIWVPRDDGSETLIQLRGIQPDVAEMYDWFHLDRGRMPRGSEIVIGASAAKRLDLTIGSSLRFGRRAWRVVGIFSSGGNSAESQIWANLDDLMSDFRRDKLSTVVLRVGSVNEASSLARRIEHDRRLSEYEAKPEVEYYEQEASFLGFVGVLAAIIGICMGIGAALGGMNVFFTSVAQRTGEIGMLRVLGFPGRSILGSFLLEAAIVGVVGSLAGATIGLGSNLLHAGFWGATFRFHVTPGIYVSAVIVGTLFAMFGGLFPAIRASRLQAVEALRKG